MSDIRKWFMKAHEKGNGNAPKPTKGADAKETCISKIRAGESDIRKWFMKAHEKGNGNAPKPTKGADAKETCISKIRAESLRVSFRRHDHASCYYIMIDIFGLFTGLLLKTWSLIDRLVKTWKLLLGKKTSKYFAKAKEEKWVEELPVKRKLKTEPDDLVKPRPRKAIKVEVSVDNDEADGGEDAQEKDTPVKSGGRAASGASTGGGRGRGGFMNFGERKDPPPKGEKEVPEGSPHCLAGLTFVISATLDSLEREEAEDLIKRHGGRVTRLYIGGKKSEKAKELGASFMHGSREVLEQGERNFNIFGGWLGKNSTAGKNTRLLEDLHVHVLASRESSSGRETLRVDYLPLLLNRLTSPLQTLPKDEAVSEVVEFMNSYSISQEDYDTIMELAKFKGRANPLEGVPPAVKTALTKKYKEMNKTRMVRAADMVQLPGLKKAPKKRIAAMLEPNVESLGDEDGVPLAENEEENESDAEDSGNLLGLTNYMKGYYSVLVLIIPEEATNGEKLESNLKQLNARGIQVEVDLKGAGKGRGRGKAADASAAEKKATGRGAGAKRKR
ncbi:hypothetical protein F2Q70_00041533 [Brassica cretica]|uniref:BRCT domain-containing protein n=1 Tax=Brassica cretica TaxID=69181 RepID=A0A8S9K6V1_BRACR|nr:hypothetical protein F2Q70_00041533 [Brassica cretica]